MSGAQIELTLQGIAAVETRLGRLASADLEDLAFNAGELLQQTTIERIVSGKAGPDGTAWPAWSADYAATRKANHSLLFASGALSGQTTLGVQNYTEGDTVKVGANAVYAAIHQFGGKAGRGRKVTIPARPYLGLSDADREAVEALVIDRVEELVQ